MLVFTRRWIRLLPQCKRRPISHFHHPITDNRALCFANHQFFREGNQHGQMNASPGGRVVRSDFGDELASEVFDELGAGGLRDEARGRELWHGRANEADKQRDIPGRFLLLRAARGREELLHARQGHDLSERFHGAQIGDQCDQSRLDVRQLGSRRIKLDERRLDDTPTDKLDDHPTIVT